MSLGDEVDPLGNLRAMAHPIRLQMLSLLTGVPMSAAELSRELDITHANASYHVRQLLAAGQIEIAGVEQVHGGMAKRYRYRLEEKDVPAPDGPERDAAMQLVYAALAVELQRRAGKRAPGLGHLTDAELWVDPTVWESVRSRIEAASDELHRAARPPRTPNTVRVNATIALFPMDPGA